MESKLDELQEAQERTEIAEWWADVALMQQKMSKYWEKEAKAWAKEAKAEKDAYKKEVDNG